MNRGDGEGAEAAFRGALREAELVDDLRSEADAHDNLGGLASARGRFDDAVRFHDAALHLRLEAGSPDAGEVRTRANLGTALLRAGRQGEAEAQFSRATELASSIHVPAASRLARLGLGSIALSRGDAPSALAAAAGVEAEARRAADLGGLAASLGLEGAALERSGDLARAATCFEDALVLDRDRNEPRAVADDLRALARLAERRADRSRASAYLRRSARVALQLGQFDAAQADLQQALRLLEEAPQADVAPVQEELERIRVAAPGGR